jgi:glycosyltransferase involved in cell wall biosynthesis
VKVLILHQHLKTPESGGALRSYYLAKALADRGVTVCFITGWNESTYEVRKVDGFEVHYLPVPYDNSFGFIKRSVSFLQFAFNSYRLAKNLEQVSVCYAISVPLTIGLPAIWLKKKKKIPFIFEVGDLWPDAPIQMGFIKNPVFASALYALEKWIYRQADSVVALSEPIRASVAKKVPGKEIHLVPNMADCDFYLPTNKENGFEENSFTGKFVVSYLGAAGIANGLDYLIECARSSAKAELPIHFVLSGEGAMLDHLKSVASKLALTNITFTGLVNRQQVKKIMAVSDAVFVCYKNVPILETGCPNKYFDGLAAGKMIIVNFGGWIKKEIEEARCGIGTDPMHPSSFITKIEPFVSNKSLLLAYQTSARQLAEEKYNRTKLSNAFASIFQKYSGGQ